MRSAPPDVNPFAGILDKYADEHRRCVECFHTKPLEAFNKNKTMIQGRSRICKDCFNRIAREKRAANRNPNLRIVKYATHEERMEARRAQARASYRRKINRDVPRLCKTPEETRKKSIEYYYKNRERILAQIKLRNAALRAASKEKK